MAPAPSTSSESTNSEIQHFFNGQTILLTGGTGFVGKLLLEKLLRICPNLAKIYVVVRAKKGKSPQDRFKDIFDYPLFEELKSRDADIIARKVQLVAGDCEQLDLGLSSADRHTLANEVTIVLHGAANVKFDQDIRGATNINVRAVREMLKLAGDMHQLVAFVYISTLFAFCTQKKIDERFYDVPITAEKLLTLLEILDDDTLKTITPQLIGKWPNTYVFTKAIAEDLIRREAKNLPIAIVRPAIITSTYKEPMAGWIDNFYGPVGIVFGASLGIVHSFHAKVNNVAETVPADYVVNCILAASWNIQNERNITLNRNKDQIPIYNYLPSKKNPLTWKMFMEMVEKHAWNFPTPKVVWYYSFNLRENYYWHKINVFFLHTVLSYVVDFVLICLRRPAIAVKGYQRMDKQLNLTTYFAVNQWTFIDRNTQSLLGKMSSTDRDLFNFSMDKVNWDNYVLGSVVGGRTYLLKESMDTIEDGKRKLKILAVLHYAVLALFWYLMYKLFMMVFNSVYY